MLVDYIAVVMLMYVRSDLLSRDYNNVLRRLLRFPPVEDVHLLVQRALQIHRAQVNPLQAPSSAAAPPVQARRPPPQSGRR